MSDRPPDFPPLNDAQRIFEIDQLRAMLADSSRDYSAEDRLEMLAYISDLQADLDG